MNVPGPWVLCIVGCCWAICVVCLVLTGYWNWRTGKDLREVRRWNEAMKKRIEDREAGG